MTGYCVVFFKQGFILAKMRTKIKLDFYKLLLKKCYIQKQKIYICEPTHIKGICEKIWEIERGKATKKVKERYCQNILIHAQ